MFYVIVNDYVVLITPLRIRAEEYLEKAIENEKILSEYISFSIVEGEVVVGEGFYEGYL